MFLGAREHEVRSDPWYHRGKIVFDPDIKTLAMNGEL